MWLDLWQAPIVRRLVNWAADFRNTLMDISSFDDLLQAARQQPQPQRLLFVFAHAELPDDATAQQKAAFEAGHGGALVPSVCVDKTPDELASFAAFVEESRQFNLNWVIVFAASLSGRDGQPPSPAEAEAPLQQMVESIKAGNIGAFIPFNRQGLPVRLG
jgi:hypothetical protein